MKITSHAFANEAPIPEVHSKKGGNVSPPLEWTGVPDRTISLVLIVDDPDAPKGLFTHWIVYGLKADTTGLTERISKAGLTREEINGVIEGHAIEEAILMGRYTNREKTRAA
jgi:Raf kinase inhibitor-like YbhB/YbcL family protein